MKRRGVRLLLAAVAVAAIAFTSRWWLPALPTFFGIVEENSDLIGALESLVSLVHFAGLAIFAVLSYFGVRSLREPVAGRQSAPSVNVSEGDRSAAVGGDVNQGAVVIGDNNTVSINISGDISYHYADVPPSLTDSAELEEALRRLEELPVDHVPERAALPGNSVMPLRRNEHFVGRDKQLKRIAAALKGGETTAIGEAAVAASSGLGGVGKTQLASEFVHRYGRFFHGVYWVSFATPDGVTAKIASCGGVEGMNLSPNFHDLPLEERVKAVMAAWQNGLPRLLIFDNCDSEDLLDRWLPPVGGSRVLVTGRRASWDPSLGVIELPLDVLERHESIELLREYRSDLPPSSTELDAIAEELGDLPLALELAGRFLYQSRREVTPAQYLESIQQPDLLEHPSLREAPGISSTKHDLDVWRTFAVSYRRLNPEETGDARAITLLSRAARLAPGLPIPEDLLAFALEPPTEVSDPPPVTPEFRDALERLENLGLVQRTGEMTCAMHRLVAAFAAVEIPEDDAPTAVVTACSVTAMKAQRAGQPARLESLLPHIRFVAEMADGIGGETAAAYYTALSMSLRELRAYDEALPYAKTAWSISREEHGPNHWTTLQRRSNVASVLDHRGDKEAAKAIYNEVLKAQERHLGPDHPDVAATLNNLGTMYRDEDLHHEVRPLYERALRIRREDWENTPTNSPNRRESAYRVAESYGNMGALYMDLGWYEQAAPCLDQSLLVMGREVGKDHDRNALNFILFARSLWPQKDYDTAFRALGLSLETYQNIGPALPPEAIGAPVVWGGMCMDLARTDPSLTARDRRQAAATARSHFEEALNGANHSHAEDHPVIGGILAALAQTYELEGDTSNSQREQSKAEAIRSQNLTASDVEEDIEAADRLHAEGTKLISYALYEEAGLYLGSALEIRENLSRAEDFESSIILLKLGAIYRFQGTERQARLVLEHAQTIRNGVCGPTHPATRIVEDTLNLLQGPVTG